MGLNKNCVKFFVSLKKIKIKTLHHKEEDQYCS